MAPFQRRTPLEAVARKLPPKSLLGQIIPERFRVSLDSGPKVLLQQLDNLPNWTPILDYPTFPPAYPPNMPPISDASLLVTAFTTGENAVLEWLGDAMISAAVLACASRRGIDCDLPANSARLGYLRSERFLAHMSLLYGMQLHDYVAHCRHEIPAMRRMCDIFESSVAAAACDTDHNDPDRVFELTMTWLEHLFEPWVASLCTPDSGRPRRPAGAPKRMYARLIHSYGNEGALYIPAPNFASDELVFGAHAHPDPAQHKAWLDAALGTRRNWRDLDSSAVALGSEYPPAAPSLIGVDMHMLTTMFTDVLYRIHIGGDAKSNELYRPLGTAICMLAISTLAIALLPTAAPVLLDEVRQECMDEGLLARLGLLLGLDRHLRVLRAANSRTNSVQPRECADVFCALVALVYLECGWAPLHGWLDKLFSPWIVAAGQGDFRISEAAQKRRVEHESARRAQYKTTVPGRTARNIRARVRGRTEVHRA